MPIGLCVISFLCGRFCEEFLKGPEAKALSINSTTRRTNGTTSLPLRAQCAALQQIVTPASATSLYQTLRRFLRQKAVLNPSAALPLTQRFRMMIKNCFPGKCRRESTIPPPDECGQGRAEGTEKEKKKKRSRDVSKRIFPVGLGIFKGLVRVKKS